MNIIRTFIELLEDTQNSEDYKKELIFQKEGKKFFFEMYYKQDKKNRQIFSVFLKNEKEFLKCEESLKKEEKISLSIGEFQWALVGSELISIPGLKHFIPCQILQFRNGFIKVKIL